MQLAQQATYAGGRALPRGQLNASGAKDLDAECLEA
jgi:hypothetical protein